VRWIDPRKRVVSLPNSTDLVVFSTVVQRRTFRVDSPPNNSTRPLRRIQRSVSPRHTKQCLFSFGERTTVTKREKMRDCGFCIVRIDSPGPNVSRYDRTFEASPPTTTPLSPRRGVRGPAQQSTSRFWGIAFGEAGRAGGNGLDNSNLAKSKPPEPSARIFGDVK
jgi:hypothetical protein